MNKVSLMFVALLCSIAAISVNGQKDLSTVFKLAYEKYPSVPYPALEALSYAQTRISNVQPDAGMDHHHGPERYGLFGLVEDGEGYFKNTLANVSATAKVSVSKLKSDINTQVFAVANVLNQYAKNNQSKTIWDLKNAFTDLFEAPANNNIDAFAKDQFLYEIYQSVQTGFEANGVSVTPTLITPQVWFDATNYKILSAKKVIIEADNTITNGTEKYAATNGGKNGMINFATAALNVDYASALWVASPNFSSRAGTAITAVAIHTMQGSYSGSISWFQNNTSNASAHYMIRSSDGQITQMVREVNKAWHAGTANPYTVGIEHEGFVNNASWYTTAMYTASANLTKDICARNNIDKTTCYSGAASSTVVVLSTAVKIKGHQHFTGQTHTDPGINWNWASYYNLINPPTCNASTTLNESYIGTNAANLNWTTATGATSYTVQWKTTAATTWNTANSTNNYYTITGLAASTAYNWRVVTNCAVGTGNSATQTFTTNASCYDAYENNNSYLAPTAYPQLNGGFVYAKVCASGDADFFKVTTTAASNINITLANLPKNYDVETFTTAGVYLQGAYLTSAASEALTMFNKPAGSYLVKIYGATTTDHDALSDYRLKITTSAPTAARSTEADLNFSIWPNPANASTTISFNALTTERAKVVVKDIYGQVKLEQIKLINKGTQQITIATNQLQDGIYFIQLYSSTGLLQSKQLIIKR